MHFTMTCRRGVLLGALFLLGGCDSVSSLIDYDTPPVAAAPADVVTAAPIAPTVDPGEAFCRSYAHDTAFLAISRHELAGPLDVLANQCMPSACSP